MASNRTGLVRHFTTRHKKENSLVKRSASVSIRTKISGPVELVHTTNPLSYNAPDIQSRSASSTTTSSKSDEDSDSTAPTLASSTTSSPLTSPEVYSSLDYHPSPEPNHLSCYFATPSASSVSSKSAGSATAPIIPQRALSHTKKKEIVSRKRSVTRFSSQSNHSTTTTKSTVSAFSRISSSSTATSHASIMSGHSVKYSNSSMITPPPLPMPVVVEDRKARVEDPFGSELEKVSEIAEEFGVKEKLQAFDDEERYMYNKGLSKFKAEDYIAEIQDLISSLLTDIRPVPTPMWI